MRMSRGLVVGVGLWLSAPPAAAATAATVPVPLVVRIYDGSGAAGSTGTALSAAATVLGEAGIAPDWLPCGGPASEGDAGRCGIRLGRGELAVRLLRLPVPDGYTGQLPLGHSLVDPHRRTGALATIYLDRVEWLARASRTDAGLLLGRAIAHEIGHLLLGTTEHAATGVMRAVWSADALRLEAEDWRFTRAHGARMRAALRAPDAP
jgi:hypothetical protein